MTYRGLTNDQLLLLTIKHLKDGRRDELHHLLDELQPYDIAQIFTNMPEKHRNRFIHQTTAHHHAILIQELETDIQGQLLEILGLEKSREMLDLMEQDDLTALLRELTVDEIEQLLSTMRADKSRNVKRMMEYPEESAGAMMTDQYVWIRHHYTVQETVEKLKAFASKAGDIYYMYVLDDHKRLVGVVSHRDLLLANADTKIETIMYSRVISVPADMDQEDVAQTIERYDFIAVPVVDADQRMVGIITVDDIIDVVISEAAEDIAKFSGSGRNIDFKTSAMVSSYRRLPWLILLLFLGLISGSIIAIFEDTLESFLYLALFMPMIAGMTGNTGTQSLAIVVRGLINSDIDRKTILLLLWREFRVSLLIAATCGLLVFLTVTLWLDIHYGTVVGASLFATLIIGTLAGTIIPLILYKLNVDPAIASGPLITTLNDIFSLFVYFGIASAFLIPLLT